MPPHLFPRPPVLTQPALAATRNSPRSYVHPPGTLCWIAVLGAAEAQLGAALDSSRDSTFSLFPVNRVFSFSFAVISVFTCRSGVSDDQGTSDDQFSKI